MITFNIADTLYVSVKRRQMSLVVNYGQTGYSDPVITGTGVSINTTAKLDTSAKYTLTVEDWSSSTSASGRTSRITFKVGTETKVLTVNQFSNPIPVWKDTEVFVAQDGQNTAYSLTDVGGKLIYKGIAAGVGDVTKPILLNRIIASRLRPQELLYQCEEQMIWETFDDDILEVLVLRGETLIGFYSFILDYSGYQEYKGGTSICRNRPITGRITASMTPSVSIYDSTDEHYWVEYNYDANNPESFDDLGLCLSSSAELLVKPDTEHLEVMTPDGPVLKLDVVCTGSAALYYVNRLGVWDYFLLEGNVVKNSGIERSYFTRDAVNKPLGQKDSYQSQVKTSWTLNTGYLTDEQSETLAEHLLSSNQVYLQDFKTGKLIPVILTTTSTEVKNYRNGRKLAQYTITAENKTQDLVR